MSTRSYIRSYDLDGNVLDTVLLGGITDFPSQDSVDELVGVNGIRALDDGSIVWSGDTSRGQHPIDPWTLVTEGSLGRLSADGTPLWTVVLGEEDDIPNMISPPEEIAMDVQPTADGGLAVRGPGRVGEAVRHLAPEPVESLPGVAPGDVAELGREGERKRVEWRIWVAREVVKRCRLHHTRFPKRHLRTRTDPRTAPKALNARVLARRSGQDLTDPSSPRLVSPHSPISATDGGASTEGTDLH